MIEILGDEPTDRGMWIISDDHPIVTREPEHDLPGRWAWRFAAERCDDTCHHPAHAFGEPKGWAHLVWIEPGSRELIPDYPGVHDDPMTEFDLSNGGV